MVDHEQHERLIGQIDLAIPALPDAIRTAFRALPRQLFIPGVDSALVYADDSVVLRSHDSPGGPSSSSQPSLMASMLAQLELRPGHSVLEVGTGSGYNAALIAEIVGPTGSVRSIEVQPDVAEAAREALARAGHGEVEVVAGDALLLDVIGQREFDRVIVTCSVSDLSPVWTNSLARGGRVVAPLRLTAGLQASVAFANQSDGSLLADSSIVCGFMPLRSNAEPALGATYALWNLPLGPGKVLASAGPTPHPDLVCSWLEGDWVDRPVHGSTSGVRIWLAMTESAMLTVQQAPDSGLWPWLSAHWATGIITDQGIALLIGEDTIRGFGSPSAADRLEASIAAWHVANQPGMESLDVRLVPPGTVAGALPRRYHDLVVRWRG